MLAIDGELSVDVIDWLDCSVGEPVDEKQIVDGLYSRLDTLALLRTRDLKFKFKQRFSDECTIYWDGVAITQREENSGYLFVEAYTHSEFSLLQENAEHLAALESRVKLQTSIVGFLRDSYIDSRILYIFFDEKNDNKRNGHLNFDVGSYIRKITSSLNIPHDAFDLMELSVDVRQW